MNESSDSPERKLRIATRVYASAEGNMKISDAMRIAGYCTADRKGGTIYQRVRRTAQALIANAEKSSATVPPSINITGNYNCIKSSVSSQSSSVDVYASESSNAFSTPPRIRNREENTKRRRVGSKEKQHRDAMKIRRRKKETSAMKVATKRIATSRMLPHGHPEKLSDIKIVNLVNNEYKTTVVAKTASMMVRQGRIGMSPMRRGPTKYVPSQIWSLLKGAFVSYIKLEQAHSSEQASMKQLSLKTNKCLNKGGYARADMYYTKKLRSETADELEIGKKNMVEQRRVLWTTFSNLNLWFDTWEGALVDLGFGRLKRPNEECDGSVHFFEGQLDRILNLDETDGALDNTTGQRGGRPGIVFYSQDVSGGASRANKTSYSPTIIAGSTASGDPLPVHFQLKTLAQTDAGQKLNINLFEHAKDVYGKYGWPERRAFPCSWGLNEKAGMNAVEFDKYLTNSILPLYPDVEDLPRKRYVSFVCYAVSSFSFSLIYFVL